MQSTAIPRPYTRPQIRFYEAKYADDLSRQRRSDARAGIDCDQETFERALEVISEGLENGQSPAHIIEKESLLANRW